MKNKVIVTGGAGFIGSGLVWALNCRGIQDPIVVDLKDNFKCGNLWNLKYSDLICHNQFRKDILSGLWDNKNIDCIFHMGACTSTTEKDSYMLLDENFLYTVDLARFALKHKVRFIYASSAATYGDGSLGFSDNEQELESLHPLNPYGWSKQYFDIWAKRHGLLGNIAGLKYFNVYGPNEYHKQDMMSFVIKAYRQITERGCVRLFKSYKPEYNDGEQRRDFVYLKDALDMTLFFYDNRSINGIFNVGTGVARSWNELVEAVFGALEKKVSIEYIDMPLELRGQYQYFTQADMGKFKKSGYSKAQTDFNAAIKDYVCNYLKTSSHLSV
ncbi:MAG: ADP-glyceromanno-heptose 6-epimerase [Candidatus Omnitrophica bacterium]|nr:ADP-glyceromanno-heptose 6-epimerase [Candidatus Omnitrophota bacterium]